MYDVAVLIERQLEPIDADQIVALHEGLDDQVTYHFILPVESSAAIMASSLTALGGGQLVPLDAGEDVDAVQGALRTQGEIELEASLALFRDRKQDAIGTLTEDDPVDKLVELVAECKAAEAIILTESHLVAELLKLDWSSRAKRKLKVPTLHLLEHEPFDAQR
ncbi:hypothetical protein BH09ACT10_BH09ACT10_25940 [soil metagenome]